MFSVFQWFLFPLLRMNSLLEKIRNKVFAGVARKSDLDRLYDQLAGLQQIQNVMDHKPVLRPMRGWAMSPDAMAWILADLQERKSPTVVEFGSGQSTVIIASMIRNLGSGGLISVEHDPHHAAIIQRQLAACGLDGLVDLRLLELKEFPPVDGHSVGRSYPTIQLPDAQIDVALIDGPPIANGRFTRYPPLQWALDHLADQGSVYLDDSARRPERDLLAYLRKTEPELRITELPSEKGLSLIERSASISDYTVAHQDLWKRDLSPDALPPYHAWLKQ
jgi:predicted O-methyltransferase YrrM